MHRFCVERLAMQETTLRLTDLKVCHKLAKFKSLTHEENWSHEILNVDASAPVAAVIASYRRERWKLNLT